MPIGDSDINKTTTTEAQKEEPTTTEESIIISDGDFEDLFNHEEDINYVENTLEGQLTLSNIEYNSNYENSSSDAYKSLAKELEMEIKNLLPKEADNKFYFKIISLKYELIFICFQNRTNPFSC